MFDELFFKKMGNPLTTRSLRGAGVGKILLLFLGVVLVVPTFYLLTHGELRLLITLFFVGGLIILWHISRSLAISANFCYLFLLGDIRRLANMFTPSSGLDPLLLVGAILALYIGLPLFRTVRVTDVLSKWMLALLGIMLLEVFNPRQGSILVGISAGLFYIVPVVWFWIGRSYGTEEFCGQLFYRVVVPLGILASLLGLYQTFVGFLPWEQAWIDEARSNGYVALFLHGEQARAFGFSVNSTEFAAILQVTAVLLGSASSKKRWFYLLPIPVLFASIFFGGSRGPILRVVFGLATVWAIRGYSRTRTGLVPRIVFASVLGFGALFYSVSQAASDEAVLNASSTTSESATAHVVSGLANPLDQRYSTAGMHAGIIQTGLLAGFRNPVGFGLGAISLGSGKFGGESGVGSSEFDISDAFLTMGVAGGVCFFMMVVLTFRYVLDYARQQPQRLAFALFGILAACLGGWLPQGQYAMAPLMLFCVGFLTREKLERERKGMSAERTIDSSVSAG